MQQSEPASAAPAEGALPTLDEGHLLDPIDRISEVLFGLFMVLTFTGTLSAATAGREDVRTMMIAAIGCNTAWGFVDAVMYVLRNLVDRGRRASLLRAVRTVARPEDAQRAIASHIGPLAEGMDAATLERIRRWLIERPADAAPKAAVTARDLKGAFGVFLLVFASTFPVVLPFFFVADLRMAMRVSAAIAIVMMFCCGVVWGRYAGAKSWGAGLVLVVVGIIVELVVIALGG